MKLPKQWRHWCRKAGLRPQAGGRRPYDWFYLKGHGRVWRVNRYAMLQCGDAYQQFDRWALCEYEEEMLPRNEAEFLQTVRTLLARISGDVPRDGVPVEGAPTLPCSICEQGQLHLMEEDRDVQPTLLAHIGIRDSRRVTGLRYRICDVCASDIATGEDIDHNTDRVKAAFADMGSLRYPLPGEGSLEDYCRRNLAPHVLARARFDLEQ